MGDGNTPLYPRIIVQRDMSPRSSRNPWRRNSEYAILPFEGGAWHPYENASAFTEFYKVKDTRRTVRYGQQRSACRVSRVCSSMSITLSRTFRSHCPMAYIRCRHTEKRSVCATRMGPGFRRQPKEVRGDVSLGLAIRQRTVCVRRAAELKRKTQIA